MNKKRDRVMRILFLALVFTLMFSMVAFADDAVMDILDQPRFGGAVKWVNKIGKIVDNWFMAVISFVSFFIISASCLRNVLAGAYCVFPKFWDGVHDAHQMTDQLSISSAMAGFKGATNWTSGSITKFLMGLLPDIKVLTDFENAEKDSIDYKQYFMKAIPQCVVAVFVGVFIYNGLYRDVMSVTSRFGVAVADNALKSVKPDDILEQMTNITVNIDYPTKNASYGTDLIANTWFEDVIGKATGYYDDAYKKENKKKMYWGISQWAQEEFAVAFSEYSNTNQYKPVVDKGGSHVYEQLPNGFATGINKIEDGADGEARWRVVCDVHSLVAAGKVQTSESDKPCYLVGYVAIQDEGFAAAQGGMTTVSDMSLVVTIPSSMLASGGFPVEGVTFTPVSGGNTYLNGTGVFQFGGIKFEFKQNTTEGNGAITIKVSGAGAPKTGEWLNAEGSAPSYNGSMVKRIKFLESSDVSSPEAQLQCLFEGGIPKVFKAYGTDMSTDIGKQQRANATQSGNQSAAGSGNTSNNDADEGDDGLDDAD